MEATETRIVGTERVGPGTVALTLETPPGFDAAPGQFVLVRTTVDGEERGRHYTLSSPTVGDTFEVTVGIDDEGTVSGWLADREPGDTLHVEGPFGQVHYDGEDDVAVVAGGPGIGGALGIAERVVAEGGEVALVYRDVAFAHQDRLAALAAGGATVVCVRERLADAVATILDGQQVFVLGFRDFVEAVRDAIASAGGDPAAVNVENFGPG